MNFGKNLHDRRCTLASTCGNLLMALADSKAAIINLFMWERLLYPRNQPLQRPAPVNYRFPSLYDSVRHSKAFTESLNLGVPFQ